MLKAKVNTSKYYNEYTNRAVEITTVHTGTTIQLLRDNEHVGTVELTPTGFYFGSYLYRNMLEVVDSYFTDGVVVVV